MQFENDSSCLEIQVGLADCFSQNEYKKYVRGRAVKAEMFHQDFPKKMLCFFFLNCEDCFEIKCNKIYFISLFSFSVLNKIIVIECFIWMERKTRSMFWQEHFLC